MLFRSIQNLADVPSKDPCELCQCVDGDIICATQECQGPPEPGCVEIKDEGSCCPRYECEATSTPVADELIKTTQNSAEEIGDDDISSYDDAAEDDYDEDTAAEKVDDEDTAEVEAQATTTTTQKPSEKPTVPTTITSPKPVSTTQLTTLLTTTLAQEGIVTTVTPAPVFGTESGDVYDPDDYYVDVDSIGPGACLFENKSFCHGHILLKGQQCH